MNPTALRLGLAALSLLLPAAGPPAGSAPAAELIDLYLIDGSVLKVTLREPRLTVQMPNGAVTIRTADVVRIDFAARVPQDVARQVAQLASHDYHTREAAQAALERMGVRAWDALAGAAGDKDAEVARRARDLLEKLRESAPEERLTPPRHDVVYTAGSKFTGRIEADAWRLHSEALGEVRLRLSEIRQLRAAGAGDTDLDAAALPDPGNLTSFQGQLGKRFVFKVTGAVGGAVWGTDVYTADSNLATAAVHAGVLRAGQAGLVRVKIVGPTAWFAGSARNGVTSQDYLPSWGAFQILRQRP
jgi:hypothetical protein